MKPGELIMYATINEDCKRELGNKDGFYDGRWRVKGIDYRNEDVDLSNGRVSISRKFSEVDITIDK